MQKHIVLNREALIEVGRVDAHQSERFTLFPFFIEDNCSQIDITIVQTSTLHAQLPVCLFDSNRDVRLMIASEGTVGRSERVFSIGLQEASEGGIPAHFPKGEYKLLIYKRRFDETIPLQVQVEATYLHPDELMNIGPIPPISTSLGLQSFSTRVVEKQTEAQWYSGELHLHTSESTGRTGFGEVLDAAREKHLDFIAVTDHFTASHWRKIEQFSYDGKPLVLQSMEVSGDFGHANIHGITHWLNPLVDDSAALGAMLNMEETPSMEMIADAVHQMGGLFCINHAQSASLAWRYSSFPLDKADLFEIWCLPEMATTFLYPTMWDTLLCQGYRLMGVGSSDSHHPTQKGVWELGQIRTWVQSKELSQPAILASLKAGRAYVSMGEAQLTYYAKTQDNTVWEMGTSIPLAPQEEVTLTIQLRNHTSGNIFIMSCGFIYDLKFLPAGDTTDLEWTVTLDDLPKTVHGDSYIRIEFHEDIVKSRFWGMAWRDHTSMRLLSNPIWITSNKKEIPV